MAQLQTNDQEFVEDQLGESTVRAAVRGVIRQLVRRHEIHQNLGKVSERHLKDIGLTQNDIQSISSMPLFVDASTELSIRANSRSTNW